MPYELIPLDDRQTDGTTHYENYDLVEPDQECLKPYIQPDLELPAHKGFWVETRLYGAVARELKCLAKFTHPRDNTIKIYTCQHILRLSTGLYTWGNTQTGIRNVNKYPVYLALEALGEATATEVSEFANIPRMTVSHTLNSGAKAKTPYIQKSEERLAQAEGYAYTYKLTSRGKLWARWAKENIDAEVLQA